MSLRKSLETEQLEERARQIEKFDATLKELYVNQKEDLSKLEENHRSAKLLMIAEHETARKRCELELVDALRAIDKEHAQEWRDLERDCSNRVEATLKQLEEKLGHLAGALGGV